MVNRFYIYTPIQHRRHCSGVHRCTAWRNTPPSILGVTLQCFVYFCKLHVHVVLVIIARKPVAVHTAQAIFSYNAAASNSS